MKRQTVLLRQITRAMFTGLDNCFKFNRNIITGEPLAILIYFDSIRGTGNGVSSVQAEGG